LTSYTYRYCLDTTLGQVNASVLEVWCKFGAGTITLSEVIRRGR